MYLIQRSNPGPATDYHSEKYLILSILKVGIDFTCWDSGFRDCLPGREKGCDEQVGK